MSTEGEFKFEDCPLKHYVRIRGWLPHCRARREKINEGVNNRLKRRLRYFTFCAIGAVDVLMLDVAGVLIKSQERKFDNVVFFDRDGDAVTETRKRIPGAIGFPGRFTRVVLAGDPEPDLPSESDTLAPPSNEPDTRAVRDRQRLINQRDQFIAQFPFDVINLDLEEFAFTPNDPLPGDIIRAIRKLATWQKRTLRHQAGGRLREISIDGFTLMFTTQIGPPNISQEYVEMLRNCLVSNVERRPALLDALRERLGVQDIAALEATRFPEFFKIGLRKLLADLMLDMDWYIDPDRGISTFEFQRTFVGGSYTMLHFVMDVQRQRPSINNRAPNTNAPAATAAYASVVDQIFTVPEIQVTDVLANDGPLKPSLDRIRARRRLYCPEAS